jgi:hypothetical protein
MDTLYLVCAAAGGAILLLQTLFLILGGGVDADVDAETDGGADAFFKVLSVKTIVAFLAFFGLAGLWGTSAELTPSRTLLIAIGAGSLALFAVAWLMGGLARLQAHGNVDLHGAIGGAAEVYLRVPGGESGRGKVIVECQGRRLECKAFTRGPELPTGARARVVAVRAPDVLEVEVADDAVRAQRGEVS